MDQLTLFPTAPTPETAPTRAVGVQRQVTRPGRHVLPTWTEAHPASCYDDVPDAADRIAVPLPAGRPRALLVVATVARQTVTLLWTSADWITRSMIDEALVRHPDAEDVRIIPFEYHREWTIEAWQRAA